MKLPPNLSARSSYLLGRAATLVQAMGERDLEPLGITPREYSVLAVLAERSPLSQTQVADVLGLDRTTILKLGASLEAKGLVVRKRDINDARAYAVALTPAGDRLRAEAFELLLACEAHFLTPLNRKERAQLHDLLARVTDL
ncbi:MAG TPA: MarR family winged helix-turn-helix transcriptional regulator [Solirubrobacteraceae bacterium]|nr:MarR family winged helix-turn-helix transcriptional regulator [Solirubrobacteraceae bacterium]